MNTLFNHFGTAFSTGWTWAFEQLPFVLGSLLAFGTLSLPLLVGALLLRYLKTSDGHRTLLTHRHHRPNLRRIP